jgi:SAM-dependent methyltransferase
LVAVVDAAFDSAARGSEDDDVRLNLGCGHQRLSGFIGVDCNPRAQGADVLCDLARVPFPFRDSAADEVLMDHVLEHLPDVLATLEEIHRICKPGAKVRVRSPHFSCAWGHAGHRSAIGWYLFELFQPDHEERYGDAIFRVERRRLHWMRPRDVTTVWRRVVNGFISWLANVHPIFCQRIWCYWVGGFEEIEFEVTVVK